MQRVAKGIFGQRCGNGVCERIVDHQIDNAAGPVSAGGTVDMDAVPIEMPAVIYGSAHPPVPQQDGRVVGAGQNES